jgi:hypothetical protein
VLGGWIYDAFGSYGSLYLVAWGFGMIAVMMAMTFRPVAQNHDAISFLRAGDPK